MSRLVALLVLCSCGCAYIDAGNVGIRINSYGTQRGVEDMPLLTGRVMYNPFTQTVHEFPTYMQNTNWNKGSAKDESITFNSSEGSNLNVDVGVSYTLERDKVPAFFVKFRRDIDTVTHGYLRNKVRDAIVRMASIHKAAEIFGEKKQMMLAEVLDLVKSEVEDDGFIIDNISFTSEIRCDDRVKASINAVIESSQKALEAENKIKQIEAEAKQKIAAAEGAAESAIKAAEAKAKSALLEAEANLKLSASLTPALIQYKALEKWDGVAPKVMSGDGSGLLMTVDAK